MDKSIIDLVSEELNKDIPIDRSGLISALMVLEKLREPLLKARVAAQTDLYTKRMQYLHPKDKDFTDMDRKVQLDANTNEYQAKADLLLGLEELLKDRYLVIKLLIESSFRHEHTG